MSKINVYNISGQVVGEQELNDNLFAVPVRDEVVYQVAVAQMANARQVLAHTKTKGEVRGGGKKPWKQKHTGRARAGSIRSPLWRGGGIVFGPRKDRNFSKKVNKKMKVKALAMVLSDKVANNKLVVVDQFTVADGKTKVLASQFKQLPNAGKKTLLSLAQKNDAVLRASKNLKNTAYIAANSLNVVDLMKYEYLVIDQAGLNQVVTTYGKR